MGANAAPNRKPKRRVYEEATPRSTWRLTPDAFDYVDGRARKFGISMNAMLNVIVAEYWEWESKMASGAKLK